MATLLVFFLILSAFAAGLAQERYSNISLGSSLSPSSDPWLSPSGLYAFGFLKQENDYAVGIYLAGIHEETVVWTATNPAGFPGDATLVLLSDGLFDPQEIGSKLFLVNDSASASEYVASASMLDNGNFVVYSSHQQILWQTFEHPTNTLLPGQRLVAGQQLFSSASTTDYSRGKFRLEMQPDGNLVQYSVNTLNTGEYAYWASGTNGIGDNVTLSLGDDGQIYLLNSTSNIKNMTQGGYPKGKGIYLMRIDVDGIFRLYFHSLGDQGYWSVTWSSTNNKCDPQGTCEPNAYCDRIYDVEYVCRCLPGFDAINSIDFKRLECLKNFTLESCKKDANLTYEMRKLKNVVWEDNQYEIIKTNDYKEGCEKACLEDCLCVAALFDKGECRKQKLPLRFGRRSLSSSTIALTKVAITAPWPETSDQRKQSKKRMPVFRIVIIISSILLLASLFLWFFVWRRKKNWFRDTRRPFGLQRLELSEKEDDELPVFTFSGIEIATDQFSDENKLGQGGFGPVYKGKLANGQEIAVKRLLRVSGHGIEQFKNEVVLISKLQHRNLVKLLGYCTQQDEKILVYEYLPNNSLDSTLFDVERRALLNWATRIRIIEGIGQGLLYLHRYSRVTIIHRDLKTSNILLDNSMNPKISDFGTARIFEDNQSLASTNRIIGTYGYMSPEYAMDGHFSVKSDVFSFGVIVLEIISGQRNTGFYQPDRPLNLLGYAWNLWTEGRISVLTDPILIEAPSVSEFIRYAQVGLLCVQEAAADRPTMSDVLFMLTNVSVALPDPKRPAFSTTLTLNNSNVSENPSVCSNNQVTISQLQGR